MTVPRGVAAEAEGDGGAASSGSGLGLAVVRGLVRAHHGRVGVDSDGLHGTTVTVDLPAVTPSAPGEPGSPGGPLGTH